MKKLFFALICGCLICAATMTVQAQEGHTADSVFGKIALNDKENAEVRRYALTRITDQSVFKQIALNDKEDAEIRRFVLTRVTDQSVFKQGEAVI